MGYTQKLGLLAQSVFQDSSLNVGIGAAPSGSYKLEVTGTAKVSGILTLGSTISNGTYAYTLPSATGTLALTSALGDYLPLAGGTLTGALGGTSASFSSSVTAGSLIVNQASTAADIILKFQINGTNKWLVGLTNDVVDDNFTIYQDGAGGGNRFTINTSGNVGIGTSSPTAISGFTSVCVNNATTGGFFEAQQGGTVLTRFGGQSDISFIDTVANIPFIIKTNSTEIMRITSDGNVEMQGTNSSAKVKFWRNYSNSQPGIALYNTSGTEIFSLNSNSKEFIIADGSSSNVLSPSSIQCQFPGSSNTATTSTAYFRLGDLTSFKFWAMQIDASYQLATFYFNSNAWAKVGYQTVGGTWTNSDERRKENIELITYGLSEVLQLLPKKFNFKVDERKIVNLGFIAQDVLPIIPEAVQTDIDDTQEYYAMNYTNLIPVLVNAIKEQQAQIQELNERLNKAGL